ncbi:MAG: ATP-binding protein [Candidatus Eisenbacteria bacterium]
MVERRFPRDVGALPAIVAFVSEFGGAHGLDADPRFDTELIIEELFTNLVKHGAGTTSEIEIALGRDGDALTIRLRDRVVTPFDPSAHRPPAAEDELGPIPGGRGLELVRRIADDVRFEHRDGVSTITVTKRIPA